MTEISTMPHTSRTEPPRSDVWRMFDRIAHRYDLLNRLLSMGQDVAWRKRMARHLPERPGMDVLDLATGTGDQLIFLFDQRPDLGEGIGIDMAEEMLRHGRGKLPRRPSGERLSLMTGDATDIPFPEDRFDIATISFGIRNVTDVSRGLAEMHRVLRPGGRALVLEFSLPANALFRRFYLFYFRHILPRVGGLISGDAQAYRYLNTTVETFPYGEAFCGLMREAGFENVSATPLTFGIASIYQGDKR